MVMSSDTMARACEKREESGLRVVKSSSACDVIADEWTVGKHRMGSFASILGSSSLTYDRQHLRAGDAANDLPVGQ